MGVEEMKLNVSKELKNNLITYAIVIVAYILIEILLAGGMVSSLIKGLLVPICIYAILAVSLNLTVGILGELSLGHAGFMCVGAFTSCFFTKCMVTFAPNMNGALRFFIALIIGAAFAGLAGILIGIPVLRLKGDYLAIVTLAFGEIIKNIMNALFVGFDQSGFHFSFTDSSDLGLDETGEVLIAGPLGITGHTTDSTFTIAVLMLLLTLFIVMNLIRSRDGRAIMSIRDNTIASESLGINITKYKLMAFSISAALAGIAGVLYAHNLATLTALPKNFGYNMSIMILVYVVLGGIGSTRGSMIAAIILTLLPEYLRELRDYRMLIYSIILIGMMLFNWAPKCIEYREIVAAKLKLKFHKKN